ncbi:MAG: glycosyltransferase [Solirubrobacteraceae bacterium]|nr:glycosyltransferase [Solirubrobacteraceae bacterium]
MTAAAADPMDASRRAGSALRVTCFALPIAGHLMPLLPVLSGLVAEGAQVDVVTSEATAERFAAVGAKVVATYPEAFSLAVQRPSANFLEVAAFLARSTEQTLLGLAGRVLAATEPDVVIVDSMAPWGLLGAELRGVPVVTSTSSFLIGATLGASPRAGADVVRRAGAATGALRSIGRSRRALRRASAVDCGGPLRLLSNRGAATIVYTSREFQPGGDRFARDVHFVGPTAADRSSDAPEPGSPLASLLSDTSRPFAHVSLGTIYNDRPQFLRDVAVALAGDGYRVTVDLGATTPADALGPLPPHVVCVRDVPQLALLDRASLFVTHGGMNSVHEALWRSVPMVVFPQAADQPVVGARLQALGAAHVLRGRDPSGEAISAAARAMESPAAREAAARLGAGLRRTEGVAAATRVILGQAARRRRVPASAPT